MSGQAPTDKLDWSGGLLQSACAPWLVESSRLESNAQGKRARIAAITDRFPLRTLVNTHSDGLPPLDTSIGGPGVRRPNK